MNQIVRSTIDKLKNTNRIELLIYTITILLVLYRGVVYELDSSAFLSKEINRSSGYIIFLSFFKKLFSSYFEYPLLIVQLIFNLYGIRMLHNCLNDVFKFQKLFSVLSVLILLAPVLYLHLTANKIMSEALCYPLYLIFIANSIYAFIEHKEKNLFHSAITLLLLVFVRGQFLSLVPIALLLSGYLFFITRKRKHILLGIIFLSIPFVSNIMDKSFHYLEYGYYVSTPFIGPSIITSVFYVSDKEDVSLFSDKDEKIYFKQVQERLEDQNWTNNYANTLEYTSSFSIFHENYSHICNHTIHEYGMKFYEQKGLPLNERYIATDNLTQKMYLPLLLDNFKAWFKLYIQNIKSSLGSAKYLLLHFIILGIGIYFMVNNGSKLGKMLVFVFLCTFSNIAFLAIATSSGNRYTFYNDWVVFIAFFLFVDQYFKTQYHNAN
ncbi:hypothetical protein [Aquimarina sp. MMG016]|uniref:hypothetical protein n=1 Tax=Aquimarina sp. MMG016 TaxID=2822690 RepID=UPI001B3A6664|nr:hypothetical protein [Aquimarina sp. MMG016]MBQ4822192.1 hypothetical protein [Aquimarina sp. MMG016]